MSLKPKFTPFPHEKKFAEKRESCDLDLKAYWENDNDDERDFVSTMREQNNEIHEYWNIRTKRVEETLAKRGGSSIMKDPSIRELANKIDKWEQNAIINPHAQDHVKELFTSKSKVKSSTTHAGHTWNANYEECLDTKDWKHHKVRDFHSCYVEDTIKFKGTMRK